MRPNTCDLQTHELVTITRWGLRLSNSRMSMNDWWLAITTAGLANVSPLSFRMILCSVSAVIHNSHLQPLWIVACIHRRLHRPPTGRKISVGMTIWAAMHIRTKMKKP